MNNFRRSVEEIVQVVKIADTTLKKRLDEFKATPSGSLTLADFRNVWLEEEMDPPAFTKGREKEEAEREATEQGCAESTVNGKKKARKKKRKGKRKREESDEEPETQESVQPELPPVDASLLNQGILAGATGGPLFEPDPELEDDEYSNIDPALLQPPTSLSAAPSTSTPPAPTLVEETASSVLAEEVSTFLQNTQGTLLTEALDEAEERRLAQISVVDELLGLDEAELDRFILSEDEVRIKERVWVELNKEYLEALAGESFYGCQSFDKPLCLERLSVLLNGSFCFPAKGDQQEAATTTKSRKVRTMIKPKLFIHSVICVCFFFLTYFRFQRRKGNNKPRDASTAAGGTTAESVRNLLKKNPKYSKRINYDALKDLFIQGGGAPSFTANMTLGNDDKDDEDLYTMDDKSDGEGMYMPTIIVEEEPGTVAGAPPSAAGRKEGGRLLRNDMEDEASDDEKGDEDLGWDDVYEQEV